MPVMCKGTLGADVDLCRGELVCGLCTVWLVCSGDAANISL